MSPCNYDCYFLQTNTVVIQLVIATIMRDIPNTLRISITIAMLFGKILEKSRIHLMVVMVIGHFLDSSRMLQSSAIFCTQSRRFFSGLRFRNILTMKSLSRFFLKNHQSSLFISKRNWMRLLHLALRSRKYLRPSKPV